MQYLAIRYTQRLAEAGAVASVGSKGDSYDKPTRSTSTCRCTGRTTKQFVDVTGGTPYATQAACERAREVQVAANMGVVEFFRVTKQQQQYEADRLGPCHCDMTMDRSSQSDLSRSERTMQLRNAEDARLRVRDLGGIG